MTVGQLIDMLQKHNPKTKVIIRYDFECCFSGSWYYDFNGCNIRKMNIVHGREEKETDNMPEYLILL